MTYLRLICRTEKLNDMDHRILSDCQALGVDLLKRNAQAYWKDERCTEVNYEFLSYRSAARPRKKHLCRAVCGQAVPKAVQTVRV